MVALRLAKGDLVFDLMTLRILILRLQTFTSGAFTDKCCVEHDTNIP